jgi:DNA (cytosine-5)-methyltransferase 1
MWTLADVLPQLDLENVDQEWQLANPQSYTARSGFKPGAYGRLDKDGVFATIVTNVDPTAKQSRVLNPYVCQSPS